MVGYLKELKSSRLRVDQAKVKQAEKPDGKYLLSTSDKSLSAEDIALGYKQLMEVERAFRTLKSTLFLRPVYRTKSDRVRSHVMLYRLALLPVRVAELETGLTWPKVRAEMERLHLAGWKKIYQKALLFFSYLFSIKKSYGQPISWNV